MNFEQVPEDLREGMVIVVDKPLEWTSFDVVNKIRHLLRKELGYRKLKVGHAGTLDPLASGVLVVCVGKMTKSIDQLMAEDKHYAGAIRFGATTPSFDAETEEEERFPTEHLSLALLREKATVLSGEIEQIPPVYSAKKIDGKKAYEAARSGKAIEMRKALVRVDRFDIPEFDGRDARFEVDCSKGTYIRSLANDLGKLAGSGAYLIALRRTASGRFSIDSALQMDEIERRIRLLGESGHCAPQST